MMEVNFPTHSRVKCRVSRTHGFTLVEMLVVMTLLSMLMLAMASVLRTTAQTEDRVDQRLARVDDMRVVTGFLQSILERISAHRKKGALGVDEMPFLISASEQEFGWVGVMPARFDVAGRQYFRLALSDVAGKKSLVLQFSSYDSSDSFSAWEQARSLVLVRDVIDLKFKYQYAAVDRPEWMHSWEIKERMPTHVMLSLATVDEVWPPIIVALRPMPGSDPMSSGPSFGVGR